MSALSRRTFVTAGAAVLTARKGITQARIDQRIEIDSKAEIGTIRPELHGHFAEHLGSCTYGGLWVGKTSSIPNINGYRRAAVEYLKELGIPVLRWPGGCFADDYHWRDGIGPVEKRPKRVNIHWGNYTEDNSFGTHEFIGLCRLINAEPYFAGNVGSGTPEEFRNWVEYCNFPSGSTLSDERGKNGSPEPFKVKYWGVGNENWGCGGQMTPQEYAGHYRRFIGYIRDFGAQPFLIACGPNSNNRDWTRGFFESLGGMPSRRQRVHGFAMHYYQNGRNAHADEFKPEHMYQQFALFNDMERAIVDQRMLMDRFDPQRQVGLMVDEWGVWDRIRPEDVKRYGALFQPITVRSGVAAALGLNAFHRQADKLIMGNIAQIVNVLHAMLLTHEDRTVRTPAYWAFMLEKGHRGKTSIKSNTGSAEVVSVSASKGPGELVVTLVNPRHDTALVVDCGVAGATVSSASARTLSHPDLNAWNTFEKPDLIMPKPAQVEAAGGRLKLQLPPLSVTTVSAKIA